MVWHKLLLSAGVNIIPSVVFIADRDNFLFLAVKTNIVILCSEHARTIRFDKSNSVAVFTVCDFHITLAVKISIIIVEESLFIEPVNFLIKLVDLLAA